MSYRAYNTVFTNMPEVTGTFEFTATCSTYTITVDTMPRSTIEYDLIGGKTESIALPLIHADPTYCYIVDYYDITDAATLWAPSFVTVNPQMTHMQIYTDDKSYLGKWTLNIDAIDTSGGTTAAGTISILLIDSCTTAELIQIESIGPFALNVRTDTA